MEVSSTDSRMLLKFQHRMMCLMVSIMIWQIGIQRNFSDANEKIEKFYKMLFDYSFRSLSISVRQRFGKSIFLFGS